MYLIPFYVVDSELAARETRVMHTLVPQDGLPVGSYGLLEFYCPDPTCDCRRVLLNIVEEQAPDHFLASISYGFDPDNEMEGIKDMQGPFLDPMNYQSEYAEALFELVKRIVLSDPRYVARLERHYALVKRAASDPKHSAYRTLQKTLSDEADVTLAPRPAHKPRRKPSKRKARPRRKRRRR